jgi:hypothetical protein
MAKLGSAATAAMIRRMTAPAGLNSTLAALTAPDNLLAGLVDPAQVQAQNAAADLVERSQLTKYPSFHVFCEKVANTLTEKFRTFSGSLQIVVDVRHSQDRLEGLQDALELYVDAVTHVLDTARGDWGGGMFYGGGYEVTLGAVKHGGKNFLQTAKITFELGVSRN